MALSAVPEAARRSFIRGLLLCGWYTRITGLLPCG
jgi:hypothetical protein